MHLVEREHPYVFNKASSETMKGHLPPHMVEEVSLQVMALVCVTKTDVSAGPKAH